MQILKQGIIIRFNWLQIEENIYSAVDLQSVYIYNNYKYIYWAKFNLNKFNVCMQSLIKSLYFSQQTMRSYFHYEFNAVIYLKGCKLLIESYFDPLSNSNKVIVELISKITVNADHILSDKLKPEFTLKLTWYC